MDRDGTAKDAGYSSLATLIAEALHIDRAKASRMVTHATQVAEELTPTGHVMPAPLPTVREALREGLIDGEHIQVIAAAMKTLPTWASLEDRELLEATLGTAARTESPSVVRQHGQILVERINQDGDAPVLRSGWLSRLIRQPQIVMCGARRVEVAYGSNTNNHTRVVAIVVRGRRLMVTCLPADGITPQWTRRPVAE